MTRVSSDPAAGLYLDTSSRPARGASAWGRPENVFLVLALVLGWIMAFLNPPFQVPDEPAHLYRVWQLTHGILLAPHYTVQVPPDFFKLQESCAAATFSPGPSIPYRDMFKGLNAPAPTGETAKYIPNTALYTPVAYLPQMVGVWVARAAHWSTLGILYAGRVGAVIGYALVGWWAIRVMPVLKWPAVVTLCAPMALFMAASLSADPMTTALAYLATAYCLRFIMAKEPLRRADVIGLGVSLVGLTLCKSAYFPIAALLFAVPRRNWTMRRWWIEPVVIWALVLIALFGWSALSKPLGVHEAGGDPAVQFHYVLYHPGKFLGNFVRTMHEQDYVLYISGIGVMGWLNTWMPVSWMNIYTAAVLWVVLTYDEPIAVPWLGRVMAALGLLGSLLLVVFGNYLVWTKTALPTTDGLQGRYLLPLVLIFFVIIQRPGRYGVSARWMALGIAWCMLLAYWVTFSRYYLV